METIVVGMLLLLAFGVLSAVFSRRARLASWLGMAGPVSAFALCAWPLFRVLSGGGQENWSSSWDMPLGSLSLGLDPLSAFFALTISGLSALSALYGVEYLRPYALKRALGMTWFFFNLLTASMILLCLAQNVLLFQQWLREHPEKVTGL